jgi:hypothetical protein
MKFSTIIHQTQTEVKKNTINPSKSFYMIKSYIPGKHPPETVPPYLFAVLKAL